MAQLHGICYNFRNPGEELLDHNETAAAVTEKSSEDEAGPHETIPYLLKCQIFTFKEIFHLVLKPT